MSAPIALDALAMMVLASCAPTPTDRAIRSAATRPMLRPCASHSRTDSSVPMWRELYKETTKIVRDAFSVISVASVIRVDGQDCATGRLPRGRLAMHHRILSQERWRLLGLTLANAVLHSQAPPPAVKAPATRPAATPPRTPWGHPDLRGIRDFQSVRLSSAPPNSPDETYSRRGGGGVRAAGPRAAERRPPRRRRRGGPRPRLQRDLVRPTTDVERAHRARHRSAGRQSAAADPRGTEVGAQVATGAAIGGR